MNVTIKQQYTMTIQDLNKAQGSAYQKYLEDSKHLAEEFIKNSDYQIGDIIIDTKHNQRKNMFGDIVNSPKEYIFGGYKLEWTDTYKLTEVLLKYKNEDEKSHPQSVGKVIKTELLGKEYIKKI